MDFKFLDQCKDYDALSNRGKSSYFVSRIARIQPLSDMFAERYYCSDILDDKALCNSIICLDLFKKGKSGVGWYRKRTIL